MNILVSREELCHELDRETLQEELSSGSTSDDTSTEDDDGSLGERSRKGVVFSTNTNFAGVAHDHSDVGGWVSYPALVQVEVLLRVVPRV
jgi:hypothetical protein